MTTGRRRSDTDNPCNVGLLADEIRQLRLELALERAKNAQLVSEHAKTLDKLYHQLIVDLFG